MLENHSHMAAMLININLHICDINTIKDNASACRVFHTVQASQKCTFTGAGWSEYRNDIAFIDRNIDSLQNLFVPKAFLQINYVYHSSSGSFP